MPIKLTTTYRKIREMQTRIMIIQGSQGAGKNIAIITAMFLDAVEMGDQVMTIMTDTYDNLKDGAIEDMRNIMKWGGYNFDEHYNKQEKDLKLWGSVIQFRYIADHKAMAGQSKRRDQLYINETLKIGWVTAGHYIGRTKGKVYLDLNPTHETWVHTEVPKIVDKHGVKLSSQIIVTFRDNEECPQSEIDYIESRKSNKSWYRVFGLGLVGTYSDRRIYEFIVADIPEGAKRIPSGMDFGVSPDPTCLVDCYIEGANLYLEEVFQMNNLLPTKIKGAERPSIVDQLETVIHSKGWMICADSSGATEIIDIRRHGFNIRGIGRPKGSKYAGIQLMRSWNIHVTPASLNLIKAFESWFWKIDHNAKIIPEPASHEPDLLAAARYVQLGKALW